MVKAHTTSTFSLLCCCGVLSIWTALSGLETSSVKHGCCQLSQSTSHPGKCLPPLCPLTLSMEPLEYTDVWSHISGHQMENRGLVLGEGFAQAT